MPLLTARNALLSIWPIVFAGASRDLTAAELKELGELSEILKTVVPGRDAYNAAAEEFRVRLHLCGVFESRSFAASSERLLAEIDRLRMLLQD